MFKIFIEMTNNEKILLFIILILLIIIIIISYDYLSNYK